MRQPPTGTVTFLFTDIEGSTKLWQDQPDAMRSALARHDQLLRQIITDNGGHVFKTVGDAFCAAFTTAPQALLGALTAQLAFAAEPSETQTPLLVRMALHTGSAEERDGDYFGQPLNRVERLMAAGHGGQTLLSLATQELTRDALPESTTFLDLGEHRLKDLGRPETVFQLLHPSLPSEFPPLASLDNPNLLNNLPQQVTSFIGREAQVAEVKALLGKTRLLTLTGAGGSGKTRLSLQVAADLLDGGGDGVWLVELASLSDPTLVPQAVAGVLGVKEAAGKTVQQSLVAWLKPKRLLLILDNCEHLVAACASFSADILRNCPGVHILASSREPLAVAGEQTYRVPSLSVPDPKQTQTAESLSQYEAVTLFIERAKAVQPSFSVTDASAPAVAQVCFHLDGIPLAIELAAARVRSLSAEEINRHMDQRFRLLTGGSRDTLPRQQTLRALIDWSYGLLTGHEKSLLRRLSVFAGGWTLAAAEVVCAGESVEGFEVLDLLTALVDKSLVVAESAGDGTRYCLLETIRQYGGDRLGESGEAEAVSGRAAACFLALAEEAEQQFDGPERRVWYSRLEAEHDNLRASLSWSLSREEPLQGERSKDAVLRLANDDGLHLGGALWQFWFMQGHLSEGRRWLDLVLAQAGASRSEASAARAKALNGAGNLALLQSDYAGARALLEDSLTLARQLGDQSRIIKALVDLGWVAWHQGDNGRVRALREESLSLWRQSGDQDGIAYALMNLGSVSERQGDFAGARALHEESLSLWRQLGDQKGIVLALQSLGSAAWSQGDFAGARALYEECLGLSRQEGNQRYRATMIGSLGWIAWRHGDFAAARALHEECLGLFRLLEDQSSIAYALMNLGLVAHYQGDYAGARALYEESIIISRQSGDHQSIAYALMNLGWVAWYQDDNVGARTLLEESLSLYRQVGDQNGIANVLMNLGRVAQRQGDYVRARALHKECLSLFRLLEDQQGIANTLGYQGIVAQRQSDYAGARALLEESLTRARQLGDQQGITYALSGLGIVAQRQSQMERSARLSGAVTSLRESIGSALDPVDQDEMATTLALAAEALGEEAFTVAWNAGRAMTLDQAVEYALGEDPPDQPSAIPSLTPEPGD